MPKPECPKHWRTYAKNGPPRHTRKGQCPACRAFLPLYTTPVGLATSLPTSFPQSPALTALPRVFSPPLGRTKGGHGPTQANGKEAKGGQDPGRPLYLPLPTPTSPMWSIYKVLPTPCPPSPCLQRLFQRFRPTRRQRQAAQCYWKGNNGWLESR